MFPFYWVVVTVVCVCVCVLAYLRLTNLGESFDFDDAKLTVYLNVEFLADRWRHVVFSYAQVLAHVGPVHVGKLQRVALNSGRL